MRCRADIDQLERVAHSTLAGGTTKEIKLVGKDGLLPAGRAPARPQENERSQPHENLAPANLVVKVPRFQMRLGTDSQCFDVKRLGIRLAVGA
jgi:hypothetical protein